MHAPATESADRLLREEYFRQMKKTAITSASAGAATTKLWRLGRDTIHY